MSRRSAAAKARQSAKASKTMQLRGGSSGGGLRRGLIAWGLWAFVHFAH
jgi:hypothetical protein